MGKKIPETSESGPRHSDAARREGATRLEAPRPEMWSKAGPWGDFLVASALGARSESVTSLEDETLASPRVQEATAQLSEMGGYAFLLFFVMTADLVVLLVAGLFGALQWRIMRKGTTQRARGSRRLSQPGGRVNLWLIVLISFSRIPSVVGMSRPPPPPSTPPLTCSSCFGQTCAPGQYCCGFPLISGGCFEQSIL